LAAGFAGAFAAGLGLAKAFLSANSFCAASILASSAPSYSYCCVESIYFMSFCIFAVYPKMVSDTKADMLAGSFYLSYKTQTK